MKDQLITLGLCLAATLLTLEVLGTVCPWLTRRQRVYALFLAVVACIMVRAAFITGGAW